MGLRRPKSTKNPPILSHEFVIQNHADIVSCVAMFLLIGLMFQGTQPVAQRFISMQHNVTLNETVDGHTKEVIRYEYGRRDCLTLLFYTLIIIVIHAVFQEYLFDKMNRKLHLSKVKQSKLNESNQIILISLFSVGFGFSILSEELKEQTINYLWQGYPHSNFSWNIKLFFILQLSWWIHAIPELYFQRVKRDDIPERLLHILLYFVFILGSYVLNLSRVCLVLLTLHYFPEAVFHFSRLFHFFDLPILAKFGFSSWSIFFLLVRLISFTLAALTFWSGLKETSQPQIDWASGNFNTDLVRLHCMAAVFLLQFWLMWRFITFHLRRRREEKRYREISATLNRQFISKTSSGSGEKNQTQSSAHNSPRRRGGQRYQQNNYAGDSSATEQSSEITENGSVRTTRRGRAKHQ